VVEAASLCSPPMSGSDSSPSATPSCAAGDLCGEAASGRTTHWLNNAGGHALRLVTLGHGESAVLDEAMPRRRQQTTWEYGRQSDAVADDLVAPGPLAGAEATWSTECTPRSANNRELACPEKAMSPSNSVLEWATLIIGGPTPGPKVRGLSQMLPIGGISHTDRTLYR
jgi:hypothetical protein